MKSILLKVLINTLLGILLIFVWSRFVDLDQIFQTLKTVEPFYILIFAFFMVLSTIFRAARLLVLLQGYSLKLPELVWLNFLSQFLSFIIPIRAGEISKSLYLSGRTKMSFGRVIVWTLIDRFFDFWGILAIVVILFPLVTVNLPVSTAMLATAGLLGFSIMTVIAVLSQSFAKKLVKLGSKLLVLPKLSRFFENFSNSIIDGFDLLRMPFKRWLAAITLTFLALISDAFIWWSAFAALKVNVEYLLIQFGSAISSLTFLVPAAPGYVGSAEASGLLVFSYIIGLPVDIVSPATVLDHLITVVVLLCFGILSLYVLKFDLSLVLKKLRKSE